VLGWDKSPHASSNLRVAAEATAWSRPKRRCPLSNRLYACAACGLTLLRDRNASRNMVRYSFEGTWWGENVEIGPVTGPEALPANALALAQTG
jgi:hypothetical protein